MSKRWMIALTLVALLATGSVVSQTAPRAAHALADAPTPDGWRTNGPYGGEITDLAAKPPLAYPVR